MRKHDQKFADRENDHRGGTWIQYWKRQTVLTPIGKIQIPHAVRVPKKRASKRQWLIWFERFKPVIRIEPFFWDSKPVEMIDKLIEKYKND